MARGQYGVVTRAQLVSLGYSRRAVEHRIAIGRLHCLYRGVYAVGRPELTQHGRWMAAVLACGAGAVLSHEHAAALYGIRKAPAGAIHVSVPSPQQPRHPGIRVHRRSNLAAAHRTRRDEIPVTTIAQTLVDLALRISRDSLEAAINESDKLELTTPDQLRAALADFPTARGTARLRATLDRRIFKLTDSHLERRFLRLVRTAGLPPPLTQQHLNGFRVDFYWPELGLVVETDGLRYHRTPAEQARDRRRDQALAAAGLTPLRFTHAQVRYDPDHVVATLAAVTRRLRAAS